MSFFSYETKHVRFCNLPSKKPKKSSLASASLTIAVMLLLLILPYNTTDGVEQQKSCSRRCGVHNISHPFWLEDSPRECGDERYILSCEDNNQLILYYESKLPEAYDNICGFKIKKKDVRRKEGFKYYVQSINYNNFTIRLLDFHLGSNNSIPPYYSLGLYDLSSFSALPYLFYENKNYAFSNILTKSILPKSMFYARCPNRVEYSSNLDVDDGVAVCMNNSYTHYGNSFYGHGKSLSELGLRDGCRIEFIYLTSWPVEDDGHGGGSNNVSCADIRGMMLYGFELSWLNSLCKYGWYVELDHNNHRRCVPSGNLLRTTSPFSICFCCVSSCVLGKRFLIIWNSIVCLRIVSSKF